MQTFPTLLLILALGASLVSADPDGANGVCPPGGLPYSADWVAQAKCEIPNILSCSCASSSSSPAPSSAAPPSSSTGSILSTVTPPGSSTPVVCIWRNASSSIAPSTASSAGSSSGSSSASTAIASVSESASSDCSTCCPLYQGLEEVIEEAGLDDSQTQCYQDEVLSVVLEIISDSSLTYEEQIIQIGECLSDFMEKYPDIAILIQYIEIADWGCIQDICSFGDIFLYEATVEYFEVDSESSSFESNITQALQEFVDSGTGDCGCAEEVSEFIETIESVNKRSESCEWQEGNLIGWFSVAFQIFCDEYPEIEEYLRNITIGDEGYTIGDLCDVADQQNEQNNMLSCFEDSDEDGETDVIGCLEDGIESDNSTSDEIKEEALNFTQSCQEQYESECGGDDTTCMLEVTYELFSQLSSECQSFLFSIEIQTIQIQITFYELIFNGLACSQGYACGNITEACSGETYEQMCEIGSYGDCTILDVFYEYMSNQSVVVKTQLQSYYNSIKICVNNSNPPEEKYECAKKYIDIAYTNDCDKRQDLFSTEISTVVSQEYSEEDEEFDYSYGTLGGDDSEDGFCSCSCEAACGGESSSSSSSTAASSSPIPA